MEKKLNELIRLEGEKFLQECYLFFLKREIDIVGQEAYLAALEEGVDKLVIMHSIHNSAEGRRIVGIPSNISKELRTHKRKQFINKLLSPNQVRVEKQINRLNTQLVQFKEQLSKQLIAPQQVSQTMTPIVSDSADLLPVAGNVKKELKIYQIYYDQTHYKFLTPEFTPYYNPPSEHSSVWHENGVFINEYVAGNIQEGSLYGFLSWRFSEKTMLSKKEFIRFIEQNPGYDVYYINPFPEMPQLFKSVWAQGENNHPGIIELSERLLRQSGIEIDLADMEHSPEDFLFCNYWVGSKKFWDSYMAFVMPLYNYLESLSDEEMQAYNRDAGYHTGVGFVTFIFERLFSTFLSINSTITKKPFIYSETQKALMMFKLKGRSRPILEVPEEDCVINYFNMKKHHILDVGAGARQYISYDKSSAQIVRNESKKHSVDTKETDCSEVSFDNHYQIIKQSGLFDEHEYLLHNPDVKKAKIDPLKHYIEYGEEEGRMASTHFHPIAYKEYNHKLVKNQPHKLLHYILYGQSKGLKADFKVKPLYGLVQEGVVILTTPHTQFIAKAFVHFLSLVGIRSQIILQKPESGFSSQMHFVICPQIFPELPTRYCAFQMEQSVSTRWFNKDYFDRLNKAEFVFDYSLQNIEYLQNQGFSRKDLFYLPIGRLPTIEKAIEMDEEYDVLFYGDVNCDRRAHYIDELSKHFKVRCVQEKFSDELYKEIAKAKVIVNIHYYEGALLETTRLWECLSLNKVVVSEKSTDLDQCGDILDLVDFVEIGDVRGMINRVRYWLNDRHLLLERKKFIRSEIGLRVNWFQFYLYRFLLAIDEIDFDTFWNTVGNKVKLEKQDLCLNLPEDTLRAKKFRDSNIHGFQMMPGLRHMVGWVGCGLSYKYFGMLAQESKVKLLGICEDDVKLPAHFSDVMKKADVEVQKRDCHLFSGLISNLSDKSKVMFVDEAQGTTFVGLDCMVGTVYNKYTELGINLLADWDSSQRDLKRNAIDRYIEEQKGLKVLTTYPYLVGHDDSVDSILWGFQNSQYNSMIDQSEKLLGKKIELFLSAHRHIN